MVSAHYDRFTLNTNHVLTHKTNEKGYPKPAQISAD